MAFSKPENGFAYNSIELEGLWGIPLDLEVITKGHLTSRYEWFRESLKRPWSDTEADKKALNILIVAVCAEVINNVPTDYPFINPDPTYTTMTIEIKPQELPPWMEFFKNRPTE